MAVCDIIGYLAASLVPVAFYQSQMVPLRIAALGSSVAFIASGLALHTVDSGARGAIHPWHGLGGREGVQ